MPAADELQAPVGYSALWAMLAVLALLLIIGYYAGVAWWGRARRAAPPAARGGRDVPEIRRRTLAELDRIEQSVTRGELPAREGHLLISATLRGYVGSVSSLRAPTMALADLRPVAPPPLSDAIAHMYPPEFAPAGQGGAEQQFAEALRRTRELVISWS